MNKVLPLISLFIISIISIFYWTLKSKNELYDAKCNAPDTTLAITINGEISTTFPTTNAYTGTVECTTGTGKVEWNGTKWVLTTSGITKGNTKCNAIFTTKVPTFAETILANNEVKTPLTTPGSEVSAYKESEITATTSASVSSTYQAYYFTYGTGWEANGTKFNLTGAAVTSDTYANSYSNLVGKYLVSSLASSNGSSTAGTMKTTTNIDCVYYVVSATSSSYTYKALCSNKKTTEALLASTDDDYGTSYYFRGAVTNNYVEFANKCWRIVRVGGDGSVKLILHNDNTTGAANPCDAANNSASAAFAHYDGNIYNSEFNSQYNDNAYVGFMYGTPGSTTYEATHANTNKSTILTNLETWYNNNLKTYESVIDNNVFCNDKSLSSGSGYSANATDYAARERLYTSKIPSLKCNGELSKITSKIGLITADELAFAGYAVRGYITTSYLKENATGYGWWSLSPAGFYNGRLSYVFRVRSDNDAIDICNVNVNDSVLRPVISLIFSTTISGGSGTSEDPYVVN